MLLTSTDVPTKHLNFHVILNAKILVEEQLIIIEVSEDKGVKIALCRRSVIHVSNHYYFDSLQALAK